MNWGAPHILWWLLALPCVAALPLIAWRLRERAKKNLGELSSFAALVHGRSGPWRAARAVLLVLAIAGFVIALARPQYGSQTRMLRKRGIDVVVVLDFSKSMLARDVKPSRIERAKAEISRLLTELDGDRIGIIAFAGETMEFPMTIDPSAAMLFFRDLGPYDMPVGGTAIGRALSAAKSLLDRANPNSAENKPENDPTTLRSKVVILFTDGEDHEGDPVEAAKALGEAGIKVYTVGIGSRTGEPIPTYAPDGTWTGYMRDEAGQTILTSLSAEGEAKLKEIADAAGGKYFHAPRGTVGVDQIRLELSKLKQQEHKARRVTIQEERYALLLAISFFLLLIETLLPDAWFALRWRKEKSA